MSLYLIRLDDACPTMNHKNWSKMERILNEYGVKPIVGVIPDNKDPEFNWEPDHQFWETVKHWQDNGWCIACHGFQHLARPYQNIRNYYQKAYTFRSEWAGVPKEQQISMLRSAIKIFNSHEIYPKAFFAPAHTFDRNTVDAVSQLGTFDFISDGYALRPYKKHDMLFLPSICDSPFKFPFGTLTFVFHPSMMIEKDFEHLRMFLTECHSSVITADEALKKVAASQGFIGRSLEYSIFYLRIFRKAYKTWKAGKTGV